MLTGSAETADKQAQSAASTATAGTTLKPPIPPINKTNKKQAFKLYERRGNIKNLKMISPLIPSFAAAAGDHAAEPQSLRSPDQNQDLLSSKERAIAEGGFYFHPSTRAATPRDSGPPKLLQLFPLSSPRMKSLATELRLCD